MYKFIDRQGKHSIDFQRVKCWVYFKKNGLPEVYTEQKSNTQQVYMDFFEMNHYFWTLIQRECIIEATGVNKMDKIVVYNNKKIKQFILKYMVRGWTFGTLERQQDGSLTEDSLNWVYSLHPRILGTLIDGYVFRCGFTLQEQGNIQKQCYLLFDKGQGVSNPHWAISLYLDLTAFWEKFGLNYYDIQQLPQQVYDGLRKIMGIEGDITAAKYRQNNKSSGNGSQVKQIRF